VKGELRIFVAEEPFAHPMAHARAYAPNTMRSPRLQPTRTSRCSS